MIRYDFKYNKKFLSHLQDTSTKRLPVEHIDKFFDDPYIICTWVFEDKARVNLRHSMGYGEVPIFTLIINDNSDEGYIGYFYSFLFEDESLILYRSESTNN